MSLRKFTKKQIEKFHREQAKMLAPFQQDPFPGWTPGSVMCSTDYGLLVIHPEELEHGDCIASICSRFWWHEKNQPLPHDANPYSGKWNVCVSSTQGAIDMFSMMLGRVNARPLNDEERDKVKAWRKAQEEEVAKFWENKKQDEQG